MFCKLGSGCGSGGDGYRLEWGPGGGMAGCGVGDGYQGKEGGWVAGAGQAEQKLGDTECGLESHGRVGAKWKVDWIAGGAGAPFPRVSAHPAPQPKPPP